MNRIITNRTVKIDYNPITKKYKFTQGTLSVDTIEGSITISGGILKSTGKSITVNDELSIDKGIVMTGLISGKTLKIIPSTIESTFIIDETKIQKIDKSSGTKSNSSLSIISSQSKTLTPTPLLPGDYNAIAFKTIEGTFSSVIPPNPPVGYKWTMDKLYTQGTITLQSITVPRITPLSTASLTHFYAYPSPIIKGESFKIAFKTNTITNREFKLYIFDILGQLHLEEIINMTQIPNTEFYYTELSSTVLYDMPSGIYILVLSENGTTVGKRKVGIITPK